MIFLQDTRTDENKIQYPGLLSLSLIQWYIPAPAHHKESQLPDYSISIKPQYVVQFGGWGAHIDRGRGGGHSRNVIAYI